jgi:hypothetical protein
LYKIALVSIVLVLMLVSTACAMRFGDFGNVILKTDPSTQSVDFLKFPVCGCDDGCGDTGREVILKTDPVTQSVDFLKFPTCGCDWRCGSVMDHFRHWLPDSENCTS